MRIDGAGPSVSIDPSTNGWGQRGERWLDGDHVQARDPVEVLAVARDLGVRLRSAAPPGATHLPTRAMAPCTGGDSDTRAPAVTVRPLGHHDAFDTVEGERGRFPGTPRERGPRGGRAPPGPGVLQG